MPKKPSNEEEEIEVGEDEFSDEEEEAYGRYRKFRTRFYKETEAQRLAAAEQEKKNKKPLSIF